MWSIVPGSSQQSVAELLPDVAGAKAAALLDRVEHLVEAWSSVFASAALR